MHQVKTDTLHHQILRILKQLLASFHTDTPMIKTATQTQGQCGTVVGKSICLGVRPPEPNSDTFV